MPKSYANIKPLSANKGSGVSDIVLWAPFNSFDTNGIKCAPAFSAAATNAELVTISDTHVFQIDYGFLKVNCAPSKNMFEAKIVGEQGSLKLMSSLKLFIPGSDADLHAAIDLIMNEPLIVLVKDSTCSANMYYQLGCDCAGAYIAEGGFQTGTNKDGVKGWEITINYPTNAVQIYTGVVTYPALDAGNAVP